MTIAFDIECEGHDHTIVITDEGDFVPLDHEEIEKDMAAGAMGAKSSPCISEMIRWEKDPVRSLCALGFFCDEEMGMFFIECVEHVAHYYHEHVLEDDNVTELLSDVRRNICHCPLGLDAQKDMVRTFDMARNWTLRQLRSDKYASLGVIYFAEAVLALADFIYDLFPGRLLDRLYLCFAAAEKSRLVALFHNLSSLGNSSDRDNVAYEAEIAFQKDLLFEYIHRHEVP